MAQITCRNLSIGYEGRAIRDGLNFEVNRGDSLCIVGENGSGKSTLMRTLLGLQKPIGGQIELGDGLVPGEIGYLPQQTPVQRDFPASVREIVLSGCMNQLGAHPFYSAEQKARARASMEKMDILPLSRRCFRELSGGQRQRVLLARAMCAARRVLLLDEPVAGLDPKAAAEMYRIVEKLNREEHMTILMVSHDLASALERASHILHLGRACFFGTREDYLASPAGRAFAASGEVYNP